MSEIKKIKTGRFSEMILLVFALALSFFGFFSISVNRTGELPANMLTQILLLSVFALITHLLVRFFAPYADPLILPCVLALNGIGIAMIYRLDLAYKLNEQQQIFIVGIKQLLYTFAGIFLMALVIATLKDYRKLRSGIYLMMLSGLALLLCPLLPFIGREINGSRIWIWIGFSLQPSEFAKICLAIFFAGYLVSKRDALVAGGGKIGRLVLPRFRDLGPLIIIWLLSLAILVFERDLGTSLLIFGLFVAMLYAATNQTSWLLLGAFLFTPAVYLAAKLFPHVQQRFDVWLHGGDQEIYERLYGSSQQLMQGLYGMADGGLLGTGWAEGSPSLVPFANSDFIFTSLGEELGLVGSLGILMLYFLLIMRGFKTAILCQDSFGKLLATGLSFTMGWQVFVVVGGLTRVIPSTGLTLPFMASGGSSLVANWVIVAILLRISNAARRPKQLSSVVDTAELAAAINKQANSEKTQEKEALEVDSSKAQDIEEEPKSFVELEEEKA